MPADLLTMLFTKEAPHARPWTRAMVEQRHPNDLFRLFKEAGKLGCEACLADSTVSSVLAINGLAWIGNDARTDRLARMLCVAQATGIAEYPATMVADWFEEGDLEERCSIVRALSLVARPKVHVPLAVRVVQHPGPVFDALCFDNPYPGVYLPDAAFAKMVDSALSAGREVVRIIGLVDRHREALAYFKGRCDGSRNTWRTPHGNLAAIKVRDA
jgi:hypothetical protein